MRIAVFGASGRTGVPLVRQSLERGHEVAAFVRDAARLPVEGDGLEVVVGDAYTGENVLVAVEGADAVVSVLSQSSDGPDDLLAVAGDHVLDAMREAGVERYVTLVGAGVREEGESPTLSGCMMGGLLKLLAREVLEDAEEHVDRVRATNLKWTVARAPRLTDGEDTAAYRAGEITLGFESIARPDVATFLLDVVESGEYVREMPKVGAA